MYMYVYVYTTHVDMSISSDKSERSASYYQVMWYVHAYMYSARDMLELI